MDVYLAARRHGQEIARRDVQLGAGWVEPHCTIRAAEEEITIFFGAMFSGEARKVLVNFTLQPSKNNQKFNATIAEAQLSYNA